MSVATEPVSPPVVRTRRRGRTIAIVVAGLLALAAVVGAGAVLLVNETTKDAQEVSDRFVRAVQRGDGAAAYALTDPAFREASSQQQLSALVDQLQPLVTTARPSVTGKSIHASTGAGTIAVITYRVPAAGDGSLYFKAQVRDEDGRWGIMNFRSSRAPLEADVE